MGGKRARAGDPLLAVGYVRCSTDRQELSPEAQRAMLDQWSARSGVRLVEVFGDQGVSGATPLDARPGLLAALEGLRRHGAGVLVAAKRDRIARDVVVAVMVERAAAVAGAVVRTADGSSDAGGAEGGMMRGIVDLFAQYERDLIRTRTRSALGVKKARGERAGEVPYGWRVGADGVHLEEDVGEQLVIAAVLELRAAGRSLRAIGPELAARGMLSRSGRPLGKTQVVRILSTHARAPPSSSAA